MRFSLRSMTSDEFTAYQEKLAANYARSHVRAGSWPEDGALARAVEQITALLPDGLDSADQHLYTALDGDRPVGLIWFAKQVAPDGPIAFVYDVVIQEDQRGNGYGEAMMRAIEAKVRELGLTTVRLHVFGDNEVARSLYRKLGYAEVHVTMDKHL